MKLIVKQRLYETFRRKLPEHLQDDRHFKIFYSDIRPSPMAIVGLNPGGDPSRPDSLQSASTWYEHNEHDYLDCDYAIARKMRAFLIESGIVATAEGIRAIPKLNVVFHRSANWGGLFSQRAARDLAHPHVNEILEAIAPTMLIVEGFGAVDQLLAQGSARRRTSPSIVVPSRLKVETLDLGSGNPCQAIVLGHPTGARWSNDDWLTAIEYVKSGLPGEESRRPGGPLPTPAPPGLPKAPSNVGQGSGGLGTVRGNASMGTYAPADLISANHKVRLLVASNPKRIGSASRARFALYRPGMTVAQAISAGVRSADVRWDLAHQFIELY